jgi:hypothetical protein
MVSVSMGPSCSVRVATEELRSGLSHGSSLHGTFNQLDTAGIQLNGGHLLIQSLSGESVVTPISKVGSLFFKTNQVFG